MTSASAIQEWLTVRATGVRVSYQDRVVLDGVDVQLAVGDEYALTGRSGSGKTTLILALAGLLSPDVGGVEWPALAPEPRERRAQIGVVFQAPSLLPELTAVENVTLPLRLRGVPALQAGAEAGSALREVGITDAASALPAELSGGMQQRVAIARVLAGRHSLVLADEPTGALDRQHALQAVRALRDAVRRRGGTLLLATHDEELAALLPHRAALVDGRLQAQVGV